MRKLEQERSKAYAELADAQADIDAIRMTKWYMQDRSSISSFSTIQSDADSIETIGTVFPILFLSVAILISLTTITVGGGRTRTDRYIQSTWLLRCTCIWKIPHLHLIRMYLWRMLGDIGGFILMRNSCLWFSMSCIKFHLTAFCSMQLWSLRYPAVCSRSPDCSNLRMSQ